jgi:ribose/xylose/arabinose/galactoside ABC-type transport system permease subunit
MREKSWKEPLKPLMVHLHSLGERCRNLTAMGNIGAILGLILLVIGFSFLSESFRQASNLILLVKSAAITIGIVAVGQTVVMIAGGIDLSVSSVIAITGLISASLMKYGYGPISPLEGNWCYLAILVGWITGILIGILQGFMITRYQMPAFIVTLGTMVGLRGLSVAISNSAPINALPDQFKWFSDGQIGIIPAPVMILMIVYVATGLILRYTKIGRYCHAIGGNETAARLAGIAVDRYRILFYAYSGLLSALTGTILISYIDAAVYTNGDGFQFNSVAAAIIGGTSLTGGVGGLWGTLIGSLILATIPSGMVMLNVPSWWRDSVTGAVILLAVFIDVNRQHSRKNAIRLDAVQSTLTGHYLSELLGELSHAIKKQTGTSLCRIYLVDRETGDVVPQEMTSYEPGSSRMSTLPGRSRIVIEAKETGSAVLIQDLARAGYQSVVPIQPNVQCALALPLIHQDRCIGVIELQSPGVAVLKESTIEMLHSISQPIIVPLEDAWLFESGWLVRQVRESLRHLWDDLYLGRMPLAEWSLSEQDVRYERTPGARGEALRNLLIKTIESLKTNEDGDNHGSRCYQLLNLTYIQEQAVEQIVRSSHISRRQYFYEIKNSIEVFTDMLIRNHGKSSR